MYPLFSLWLGVFLSSLRNPSLLQSHEEVFQEFLLYDMFCFYTWVFHYVAIYFCICLRWGSNLIFIFHGINQLVWPHVLMIQCLPLIWGSLFYIYIFPRDISWALSTDPLDHPPSPSWLPKVYQQSQKQTEVVLLCYSSSKTIFHLSSWIL